MTTFPISFREAYFTSYSIPAYLASHCTVYKRLVWSASYFLSQWESNVGTYAAGTIRRYNHIFHVEFCKTEEALSIGKLKSLVLENPNYQINLSFRKANGLPGYVLISPFGLPSK